jgi:hypothetical protein
MKITARMYRCTTVPTEYLASVAGVDYGPETPTEKILAALKDQFSPFAPRVQFFFDSNKTVVGIEALAFEVPEPNRLFSAGLIHVDPVDQEDVVRADGALQSEMGRFGISVDTKDFDWKVFCEKSGN